MPYIREPEIPGFLNRYGGVATGFLISGSEKDGRAKASCTDQCTRCGGEGGSIAWKHTGYTCYKCAGSGVGTTVDVTIYTPEGYAKMAVARDKRKAKRDLKKAEQQRAIAEENAMLRDSRFANFSSLHPGLFDRLALHAGDVDEPDYGDDPEPTFLAKMHALLVAKGELTDNQANAVIKVFAARDAKDNKIKNSQYLGNVGDKLKISVKNILTKDLTNRDIFPIIYKYLVIMETECGQQVKYIGNGNSIPYKTGDTKIISCKIKSHEVYNGVKQTCIERPRAVKPTKDVEDE